MQIDVNSVRPIDIILGADTEASTNTNTVQVDI